MSPDQAVSLVDLLRAVANGDRASFRELYAEAGGRLFAVCLRLMRNREEAEDVLQEAFIRIWERSYLFDPARGDALGWMATIARNCAVDRLRRPGRRNLPFDEAVAEEIDAKAALPDTLSAVALRHCLENLRPEYREVIVLSYINGMTHDDLAQALGRPSGTVKSWIRRGLEQLKGCMDR